MSETRQNTTSRTTSIFQRKKSNIRPATRPPNDQQATTNQKDRKKKDRKNNRGGTPAPDWPTSLSAKEVQSLATKMGESTENIEKAYDAFQSRKRSFGDPAPSTMAGVAEAFRTDFTKGQKTRSTLRPEFANAF